MIKSIIKKIKDYFSNRNSDRFIEKTISDFTNTDWNQVTAGVMYDLIMIKGERSYSTLTNFINANSPSVDLANLVVKSFDGDYKNLLMRSHNLTEEQKKLLKICKTRKIQSSIIPILETIDEYDSNNYNSYIDNIIFDNDNQ